MATHSSVLAWEIPRTEKPAKSGTRLKQICSQVSVRYHQICSVAYKSKKRPDCPAMLIQDAADLQQIGPI